MTEAERLRKLAQQKRRAVTNKIGRVRRSTGIEVSGTVYDPRRAPDVIKSYNARQLANYIKELSAFTSRSTSFLPGSDNNPISRQAWLRYKSLESRYNSIGAQHEDAFNDVKIPGRGMTIGERNASVLPKLKAEGEATNRPYGTYNRDFSNVQSAEALAKLSTDLERRLDRSYLPGQIKESRRIANDMLDIMGESDIKKRVNKLTQNQFNIFWNYGGGASNISGGYNFYQMISASVSDGYVSRMLETNRNELDELISWAETLPKTHKPKTTKRR